MTTTSTLIGQTAVNQTTSVVAAAARPDSDLRHRAQTGYLTLTFTASHGSKDRPLMGRRRRRYDGLSSCSLTADE